MCRGGGSTCVGGGVGRLARCRGALAAWHFLPVLPGDSQCPEPALRNCTAAACFFLPPLLLLCANIRALTSRLHLPLARLHREEIGVAWGQHNNLGDYTTAALAWLERCGQREWLTPPRAAGRRSRA